MLFRAIILVGAIYALISATACRKPFSFSDTGELGFSTDSVKFDTIFTTLPSPTRRLVFRNLSNQHLKISSIELADGVASDFQLLINGDPANAVQNFELAKGDSAYIFVSFKSPVRDAFAADRILFKTKDKVQSVVVSAFVRDAYFLADTFIACDTTFTADKAIVVDGPLFVPEGCTLTMQPGTHIYFTSRKGPDFNPASYLIVSGTLRIQGSYENPVILEGNRLDPAYAERGGQWFGVYLTKFAQNCEVRHALIKNAVFGIRSDSVAISSNPKLKIVQTEIRNMEYYGIWMVGFAPPISNAPIISAENVLVANCAKQALRVNGGGQADFTHCSFASFNFNFNRKEPLVLLNNFGQTFAYPLEINFYNSVIYGQEDTELLFEDAGVQGAYKVWFQNCLLKHNDVVPGDNNILNQDPLFLDPRLLDFRPALGSPLIDKAANRNIFTDLRNNPRPVGNGYDIGCYEFNP
jgi:hypothetical protein